MDMKRLAQPADLPSSLYHSPTPHIPLWPVLLKAIIDIKEIDLL